MTIEFTLNTGVKITARIDNFNSEEFAAQLNNLQTLFVTVGNNGFSKHSLLSWNEAVSEGQVARTRYDMKSLIFKKIFNYYENITIQF